MLWRKWKRFNISDDLNKYKQVEVECREAITKFNAAREIRLIRANNVGSFYKFVNNKLKPNILTSGSLKDKNGNFIVNVKDKVDVFNEYFTSVFTIDNGVLPSFDSRVDSVTDLSHVTFTPQIIFDTLRVLKGNNSTGPDGIPNILLKKLCSQLCVPLCHIFTISFGSQQLPDDWKHAFVTPLFNIYKQVC